jgi:hypothetical protein
VQSLHGVFDVDGRRASSPAPFVENRLPGQLALQDAPVDLLVRAEASGIHFLEHSLAALEPCLALLETGGTEVGKARVEASDTRVGCLNGVQAPVLLQNLEELLSQ